MAKHTKLFSSFSPAKAYTKHNNKIAKSYKPSKNSIVKAISKEVHRANKVWDITKLFSHLSFKF